ncbi:FecR family protein [Rhizosphaericola mali]|uniref:FecR family protein n=1 Tax=Rhizosphaericola mali TaxID=2545455 RepID=A0A5P2G661_9BACT|nr:FecR family protein [Rhizosphaericola mali]QES88673.1 FecR family protein [Rhizosphaericola mali]
MENNKISQQKIEQLAEKKLLGTISDEEDFILSEWLNQDVDGELDQPSKFTFIKKKILTKIQWELGWNRANPHAKNIWKIACAIIVVGISIIFYEKNTHKQPSILTIHQNNYEILLTTASGKKIELDSIKNSVVRQGRNYAVIAKNGTLIYQRKGKDGATFETNEIATPPGKSIQIVLSDGTKVWLNESSSISFPAVFNNDYREIKSSGEVYLEVAKVLNPKGKRVPFIVKSNNQSLSVLGTHFDVNAYDIQNTKTTLVEGKVEISSNQKKHLTLLPNQQAQVDVSGADMKKKEVDPFKLISWTKGYINFENASAQEVLNVVGRWYHVNLIIKNNKTNQTYSGKLNRNLPLTNTMEALRFMHINFEISKS